MPDDTGISPTASEQAVPVRASARALALLASIPVLVVILDQVVKQLSIDHLVGSPPVRLLGGLVYLNLTFNSGAAYSVGVNLTYIFPIVAIAVIVLIIWLSRRLRSVPWAVAFGLVIGGALGNVADRLFRAPGVFRGQVVDMISLFDPAGQCSRPARSSTSRTPPCSAASCWRSSWRPPDVGVTAPARPAPSGDPTTVRRRELPLPEGLDGMRLDLAVSRLFGLSRTAAATLVDQAGRARRRAGPGPVGEGRRRLVARRDPARAGDGGAGRPATGGRVGDRLRRRRSRRGGQAGGSGRPPEPRLDRADRDRRPGRDGSADRHQRGGRTPGRRAPTRRRDDRAHGGGEE